MSTGSRELAIPPDLLGEAIATDRAWRLTDAEAEYVRFADDHHGIPRGTVILGERVLPAYPPIGRIFALERGIRKNFPGRFFAEEKVDGYNVRIVRHRDRLLPFTRGGFICPFTVDRLADLGNFAPLFAAHPDLVLCGEVVGPGNPYMEGDSPRTCADVSFFAFDFMQLDRRGTVPIAERESLCERFDLPCVPRLGWFTSHDMERIRREVLRLDSEGAEGIIFKPEADGLRVKYVTPEINVADIALDGELLAELPAEFFLGRLLRLAIGLEELRLDDRIEDAERRIGRAFISRFLPVVREVAAGRNVTRVFDVRLHSHEAADRLLRHLDRASRKVKTRELARRRDGGWVYLRFEKTFLGSTARLKSLLDGDYVID